VAVLVARLIYRYGVVHLPRAAVLFTRTVVLIAENNHLPRQIVCCAYRLPLPKRASANSSDTSMSLCSKFQAFSLDQLTPSFS